VLSTTPGVAVVVLIPVTGVGDVDDDVVAVVDVDVVVAVDELFLEVENPLPDSAPIPRLL